MYLHIVPVTNILCQTNRPFAFSKIGFCAGTKVFDAVKFLGWLKKFGLAQNILGPVKGQGIKHLGTPVKNNFAESKSSFCLAQNVCKVEIFQCPVLLQVPKCFVPVQIF